MYRFRVSSEDGSGNVEVVGSHEQCNEESFRSEIRSVPCVAKVVAEDVDYQYVSTTNSNFPSVANF